MAQAQITQLRLTSFKSFRNVTLPLKPITFLTGLNSSGKSNALDALDVLSRLARGISISDALAGTNRLVGPIRGGAAGCAPHGHTSFVIGCRVEATAVTEGNGQPAAYEYDVEIQVEPELRILAESLTGPGVMAGDRRRRKADATLFSATTSEPGAPTIEATVFNGKKGSNPKQVFRDTKLILAQVADIIAPKTVAEKSVHDGATIVAEALASIFHLDPVPTQMREYVAERDDELRRTGDNLSAALKSLQSSDPSAFSDVEKLARELAGNQIVGLDFPGSPIGDVIVALKELEGDPPVEKLTSAKEMSDGMLRFLAIATALKSPPRNLDVDRQQTADSGATASVQLVIEEVENGLHPSQADKMLRLLEESYARHRTQSLVTTHSPALLDSIEGDLSDGIMVCYRDDSGFSHISPIRELPDYVRESSQRSLGTSVTRGKLVDGTKTPTNSDSILELFLSPAERAQ